jgi:hypothetical protein
VLIYDEPSIVTVKVLPIKVFMLVDELSVVSEVVLSVFVFADDESDAIPEVEPSIVSVL